MYLTKYFNGYKMMSNRLICSLFIICIVIVIIQSVNGKPMKSSEKLPKHSITFGGCFRNTSNNNNKMDQNINSIEPKHLLSLATMELALKMMKIIDSNEMMVEINEPTKNLIMSPFSIQMLLNLLLMGSSGENRQELLNILNYSQIKSCSPDGDGKIISNSSEFNPHEIMKLIQNEIKQQIEHTNSIYSNDNDDGDEDNNDNDKNKNEDKAEDKKKAQFHVANLILTNYKQFGKMPENLNENFLNNLKRFYKNVKIDSFNDDNSSYGLSSAKELIDSINQWVNLNTKGKIDKMFESENDLGDIELLMMIMANSVYFKSNWLKKFDDFKTKEKVFYSNFDDNDELKLHKFMTDTANFDYLELTHQRSQQLLSNYGNKIDKDLIDLNSQVLSIPFKTTKLSMIFILPKLSSNNSKFENDKDKFALENLQQKLNAEKLMKIFQLLDLEQNQDVRVDVEIPKFKLERQLDIRDLIEKKLNLGKRIFQYHPNGYENLFPLNSTVNQLSMGVDQIIHKAMIEIDENGVEAAAVTLATMCRSAFFGSGEETPEFIANHPFLFFILHTPSKMPLFMGRVTKL